MNGRTIKDVLSKKGIAQAEIAKILGITPNNLNNMLAKEDVRTGLLEGIAEAANLPISVFYGDSYNVIGNSNTQVAGNVAGNDITVGSPDKRLLDLLVSKDDQLTMAMKQTSKAQEQVDKAQSQIDRILDKYLGRSEEI